MHCIVKVSVADGEVPRDMVNTQREIAKKLKRPQLCVDFLPIERSASPEPRVDCYLFDVAHDQNEILKHFQTAFRGTVTPNTIETLQIDWQLAWQAAKATEMLLKSFWDDFTLDMYLAHFLVASITANIGCGNKLNRLFFTHLRAQFPVNPHNDLSQLAQNVTSLLVDACCDENDRFYHYSCHF